MIYETYFVTTKYFLYTKSNISFFFGFHHINFGFHHVYNDNVATFSNMKQKPFITSLIRQTSFFAIAVVEKIPYYVFVI